MVWGIGREHPIHGTIVERHAVATSDNSRLRVLFWISACRPIEAKVLAHYDTIMVAELERRKHVLSLNTAETKFIAVGRKLGMASG